MISMSQKLQAESKYIISKNFLPQKNKKMQQLFQKKQIFHLYLHLKKIQTKWEPELFGM